MKCCTSSKSRCLLMYRTLAKNSSENPSRSSKGTQKTIHASLRPSRKRLHILASSPTSFLSTFEDDCTFEASRSESGRLYRSDLPYVRRHALVSTEARSLVGLAFQKWTAEPKLDRAKAGPRGRTCT